MKKKLLVLICVLTCLIIVVVGLITASCCRNNESSSSSTPDDDSVKWLNIIDSAVTLDCFENYALSLEKHDIDTVSWTSSDPSIVSVDENGKLTAGIKLGTATITACGENYSDDCAVTVLLKSGIPEMKCTTQAYVSVGGSYDITFNVYYNSIDISEYLTFKCNAVDNNDEAIVTALVNGNVVTFSGLADGEADFTVYTTVFDRLYAENITISVRNTDVVYVVNGGVNNRLQLRANKDIYTSNVEVYYKNERVADSSLVWSISDDNVATIGEGGKLVMNKEGVAVLSTNYLGRDIAVEIQTVKDREYINVEQESPFDVDLDVSVNVDTTNKKREYIVNESKTNSFNLCETGDAGFIVRASLDGNSLNVDECDFSSGVAKIPANIFGTDNYGEKTLIIEVEFAEVVRVYTLDVLLITKKINSLTEFQKDITIRWQGDRILGYFVLDSDIDFSYYEISVWATDWNYDNGFRGTLDGRGYSLKNMKSVFYGITAQMGEGAVIKNIVIPNLRYSGGETTLFTRGASGVTFDNIQITLSSDSTCSVASNPINCGLLIDHVMKNCVFKNITINAHGKDLQKIFGGKNENYNTSLYENIIIYANTVTYYENDIKVAPDGVTFVKA